MKKKKLTKENLAARAKMKRIVKSISKMAADAVCETIEAGIPVYNPAMELIHSLAHMDYNLSEQAFAEAKE